MKKQEGGALGKIEELYKEMSKLRSKKEKAAKLH
jgi:hypothetical protein